MVTVGSAVGVVTIVRFGAAVASNMLAASGVEIWLARSVASAVDAS